MKRLLRTTLLLVTINASVLFAAEDWQTLLDPDLSQWEVWIGAPHTSVTGLPPGTPQFDNPTKGTPLGLNNDPKHVFRMETGEDGQPVLHISGEIYGGLTTLNAFSNYHFSAQFKWGERKWEPRPNRPRDNGILYHCTGPHGAFWNVWKRCVEFQVQERDFGDLFLLAGTGADVRLANPDADQPPIWDPSQPLQPKGRVRRSEDHELPHGEWNTLEVYTIGRRAVHVVNGHVVMAIENTRLRDGTPLDGGQIQLQSEAAEAYYREVKIRPLNAFPAAIAQAANFAPIP